MTTNSRRGQRFMLIVMACFLLPLLLAIVLVNVWKPSSQVNYGTLMNPVQTITQLDAQLLGGNQNWPLSQLQGHWSWVWVTPDCQQTCQKALYAMRQLRFALGRERGRMRTVLLVTQPAQQAGQLLAWADQYDQELALVQGSQQANQWFSPQPGLFLVDPLGNVVLRYSPQQLQEDTGAVLKDVKRLFKYSKIG